MWESSGNRDGKIIELSITPVEEKGRVIIGFVHDYPSDLQKFGIMGAVSQSIRRNFELSSLTFKIIGRIIKGSASVRTLSGPIEIARISGALPEPAALVCFFGFLGLVSLQLGVFNLLRSDPGRGCDSSLLIEGLIRRDLSLNLKERIVQVGFVFLILLMGFVVFNDLSKIIDIDRIFR